MEKEKSCKCIEDKSSHHSCELYGGISKEYLPTYIKLKQSGVINNDGCVSLNGEMVPYYFLNDDCTNFPDHASKVLWKLCKKHEEEKPKQEPNPSFDFVIDIIKKNNGEYKSEVIKMVLQKLPNIKKGKIRTTIRKCVRLGILEQSKHETSNKNILSKGRYWDSHIGKGV